MSAFDEHIPLPQAEVQHAQPGAATGAALKDESLSPSIPSRRRVSALLARVMAAAAWLLLAATLSGFGGRLWWAFGLAAPFRMQLAEASAAVVIMLLLRKALRRGAAKSSWHLAAAMAALLINGVLIAPLWFSPPLAPAQSSALPPLTVFFFNVSYGNHLLDEVADAQPIAAAIAASGADIVVAIEVTMHRLGVLEKALPGYRMVAGRGRPDPFGIAIFVKREAEAGDTPRLQVHSADIIELANGLASAPQVELRCTWAGRPLSVLGVHTVSAVHARTDRYRTAMLAGAAAWANRQRGEGRAVVIAGDFNATPWCPPFVDLLDETGLTDSMKGFGAAGTWPSPLPAVMRIPIDHCLHSIELSTTQREVGGDAFGSDHLPLTVELHWRDTKLQTP